MFLMWIEASSIDLSECWKARDVKENIYFLACSPFALLCVSAKQTRSRERFHPFAKHFRAVRLLFWLRNHFKVTRNRSDRVSVECSSCRVLIFLLKNDFDAIDLIWVLFIFFAGRTRAWHWGKTIIFSFLFSSLLARHTFLWCFFYIWFCLQVNSVDLDPTNTLVVTGTMDGKYRLSITFFRAVFNWVS